MNVITVGGCVVYDPPKPVEGLNILVMNTGASRWGIGRFCISKTDYDGLGSGYVRVIMGVYDSVGKVVDGQEISLLMLVAGYIPLTGVNADFVEVILFDKRVNKAQFDCIFKAFNVPSGEYDTSSAVWTDECFDSTVKTVGPPPTYYNWHDVFTWASIHESANLVLPIWTPLSLTFDKIPKTSMIDDVCTRLFLVVGYDWVDDFVTAYNPGEISPENQVLLDKLITSSYNLPGGGDEDAVRGVKRMPTNIVVTFRVREFCEGVVIPAEDPYVEALRYYGKTVAAGGSGPDMHMMCPEYYAFWDTSYSVWKNQTTLDAIATDLAGRAKLLLQQPLGQRIFAGIWPFKPDGHIRSIMWISDRNGARTHIRFTNDRDFEPYAELKRSSGIVFNSTILGLGDLDVINSPSGTLYLRVPQKPVLPNGDVDCQTLNWDNTHERWYAGPARLM